MFPLTDFARETCFVRSGSTRSEIIVSRLRQRPEGRRRRSSISVIYWPVDGAVCSPPKKPSEEATGVENTRRSVITSLHSWRKKSEPRTSWIMLAFCIIPICILAGIEITLFGFFYVEYVEYFEVPSSVVGLTWTVRTAVLCLSSLVNSTMLIRLPARRLVMSGGVLVVLGLLFSSFVPNVYFLYVTNGLMQGLGSNMCLMALTFLTQKHFKPNRAFALGFINVGFSSGCIISPVLVTKLIETYGWRGATLLLSALYLHVIALGWLCKEPTASRHREGKKLAHSDVRTMSHGKDCESQGKQITSGKHSRSRKPVIAIHDAKEKWKPYQSTEDDIEWVSVDSNSTPKDTRLNAESEQHTNLNADLKPAQPDNRKKNRSCGRIKSFLRDVFDFSLLKDRSFVMICFCSMLGRYNLATYVQHFPRKAAALEIPKDEVSYIMSLFSIVVTVSGTLVTIVANLKWTNEEALVGSGILLTGIANCLTSLHSIVGVTMAAVLQGVGVAFLTMLISLLLVNMVGLKKYPKALALFLVIASFGGMTAVPLTGYIYDVTHNYDTPFILAGVLGMAAGSVILLSLLVKYCGRKTYRIKRDSAKKAIKSEITNQRIKT